MIVYMSRTTIAVQVPTRDRIAAGAQAESMTIDTYLARLLDEHEDREFWAAMERTSAADYKAAMLADGTWPGDDDYSVEERTIRREEGEGD